MRNWHSLYDIFRFPLLVMLFAMALLGIGNSLTNTAFAPLYSVRSDFILLLGNAALRTGTFLLVNFPLLALIRFVTKKGGSATTVTSALTGYITFHVMTMYFAHTNMSPDAYSSILGLSMTSVDPLTLTSSVHYPLQMGIVATIVTGTITLWIFERSRRRWEYSLFAFISRDVWCVIVTTLWCAVGGIVLALIWPYFLSTLQIAINFITSDTANPVNIGIYGMLERVLAGANLLTLIRSPFWYGANSGSWISMGGASVVGDVNIWTAQFASGRISGMSGHFITPYYILNLFAVPGMLWACYSLQTDRLEKRRTLGLFIVLTVLSYLSGTLFPLELGMIFLCPLLYFLHLGMTGILFGVLQAMHVYLGYQSTSGLVMTAMPGSLAELLVYLANPSLAPRVVMIIIVGFVYLVLYYLLTQVYFRYLAIDIFRTGGKERMVQGTLLAVGGIENVKMVHSSVHRLTLGLYDHSKLNVDLLRKLGGMRIVETKAGYAISFGAASTIVRQGIQQRMRRNMRELKEREQSA